MIFEVFASASVEGPNVPVGQGKVLVLQDLPLLAVASGVGGPGAGDVASGIAMDVIRTQTPYLRDELTKASQSLSGAVRPEVCRTMQMAFEWAHDEISAAVPGAHAGASLLTLALGGGHAYLTQTGTCRAFLYRSKELRQISDPVDSKALCGGAKLSVSSTHVALADGDVVLLCSDGLVSRLRKEEIADLIQPWDLKHSVNALTKAAVASGAKTGVSVVLGRVGAETVVAGPLLMAEAMRSARVFEGLSVAQRFQLVPFLEERRFKAGEVLVKEKAQGDRLLVVTEGSVAISRSNTHLINVQAGGHVGEVSFGSVGSRSATVVAKSHGAVLELSRARFEELAKAHPEIGCHIALVLLETATTRLRDLTERVVATDLVLSGRVPLGDSSIEAMARSALHGELTRAGRKKKK